MFNGVRYCGATEKMSLSGWEALADVRQETKALVELEKLKIVWPGVLSPASVGRSGLSQSDRFRQNGKVKWLEGLAVNWQRGWVGLAGRRMEKVSLSGWEALASVQWELNTCCVGQVKTER